MPKEKHGLLGHAAMHRHQPSFARLALAALACLSPLLACTTLHAQSVTIDGDVVPTPDPAPGPSWNPTGDDFFIGNTGPGSLTIAGGGTVTASHDDFIYVAIGHETGSDGTVTVTGAGSLFSLSTNLYVGVEGAGRVLVEDGGALVISNYGALSLGTYGGTGDVTVTGAGSELRAADIGIGNDASDDASTLTIAAGGLVNLANGNGAVFLADSADARGVLNFGAHDLAHATTAGTLAAGAIYFGNGAEAVLNFNQTDSLTLAANLSEGTSRSLVHQRGTGTTTLTGDNTDYDGDIKVSDGTLVIASETTARDVTVSGAPSATLRVANGGALTLEDGSFYVANDGGGTLVIEDGGTASGYAGGIGSGGHAGHAIVTGFGSQWTLDEDLLVGDGGHGTLTLADEGNLTLANGTLRLALDPDSTGTLNFGAHDLAHATTAGTLAAAEITFGWNDGHSPVGEGTINFNQTDNLTLAAKLSGTGTLNQRGSGTTTLTNAANTYAGQINVSDGELAFTHALSLTGDAAAAATVTGTGKFTTTGNLNLGLASGENPTLLIDGAGASVSNAVAAIGYAAGSTGTVTVRNGATWTNTSELHIGEYGTGSLILGADAADTAATVTTTNLVLGVNSSGTGTLTLNGGSLTTNYTAIGYSTGSTGTVNMTGGTWNSTGLFVVGNNGSGTFTQSGGAVTADEAAIAYNANGTGTLNLLGGGTITLNSGAGTLTVARVAGSTGTLNFGAHDLAHATAAGTLNAAAIAFGAGNGTINFNQDNALTLAAVISGNGAVNQRGAGVTTLTAANTHTGATRILDGTLKLGAGGSLANTSVITVASGATFDVRDVAGGFTLGAAQTLAGDGAILGDAAIAGALAVGDSSVGLLTFDGDLSLASTATLRLELGGADRGVSYDAIDVTGDLAYGGTLEISLIDDFSLTTGDTFRLFNTGGSGAFADITIADSPWTGVLDYGTGWLTITAVPEPAGAAALAAFAALAATTLRRRRSP